MSVGTRLSAFGEVKISRYGVQMVHPEHQVLSAGKSAKRDTGLMPIYPTGKGLHQNKLRQLIRLALTAIQDQDQGLFCLSKSDL